MFYFNMSPTGSMQAFALWRLAQAHPSQCSLYHTNTHSDCQII